MDQTNQSKQERTRSEAIARSHKRLILWVVFVVAIVALMYGMYYLSSKEGQSQKTGASQLETSLAFNAEKDRYQGNKEAKTVLIEYADFQCPACRVYYTALRDVEKAYSQDVVLVYRYFPLSQIHFNAKAAAYAAEAAYRQGKFWEMHDQLFETQETWSRMGNQNAKNYFITLAKTIGLDTAKFTADMNSREIAQLVDVSYAAGEGAGVNSTPTLFLDGKKIEPTTVSALEGLVEEAIKAKTAK